MTPGFYGGKALFAVNLADFSDLKKNVNEQENNFTSMEQPRK